MKTILQKLIQDLWLSRSKLLLSIIATAMATWGIVTVSFTFLLSERDFKTNYEGAYPSDITLVIDNFNDSLLTTIKNDPAVEEVERRELLTGQIQSKNGTWMPLMIFGVASLEQQKLDRIALKEEFKKGTFFIEQNAAAFLGEINESVNVKIGKDRRQLRYEPAGFVHDPLQAPAQMERIFYGYTSISSIDSLLMKNTARFIIRVVQEKRDHATIKRIAEDISLKLEKRGAKLLGLEIREPGKHIHQPIIEGVSFLQISFGSVLLLLGVTLFAMILFTWLVPQIPDIGIMKSLGATRQEIFKAYVTIILVIAGLGLFIGFPIGLLTASKFNGFIALVQNFDPVYDYFPIQYYVAVALLCLVPPVVVGLIPIHQITLAPVRQALNTMFYKEPGWMVRLLVRANISSRFKYSINNVFRNGFRTYLLLVLLCVGLSLYFTGSILSYSFDKDLTDYFEGTPYQMTVNLPDIKNADIDFIKSIKEVKSVVPTFQMNTSYQFKLKTHQVLLTIYPKDYQIRETMFLAGAQNKTCHDCIFIHPQMLQEDFKNVEVGEEVILTLTDSTTQKVKYGGVIRDVFPGRKEMMFWFVDSPLDQFNTLNIELKDPSSIEKGIQALETRLNEKNFKFRNIKDIHTSRAMLVNHLQPTYLIVQAMGIFTIVISLLGMLIVISLTLKERTAEMGIIKALGGSAGSISKLLVLEFLSITLLAIIVAWPLAKILSEMLCHVYGEMIRGFGITPTTDYFLLFVFTILVIIVQSLVVMWFSKQRIRKTSLELINNPE
jgi:putative ABC transport system permease protein